MRGLLIFFLLTLLFSPTTIQASPDVDFPQEGYSYGGKVRSGPSMNHKQVGSLFEGDRILILNGTGAMMNGYEWFKIRYRNGRVGYQWGGIMCSQNPYPTIFRVCNGPKLQPEQPVSQQFPVFPSVNGYVVSQVNHALGSFANAGNGQWHEIDMQGQVTFQFQEEYRDEWSVYLFDASRNVSIQIDLYRGQISYAVGSDPKTDLYSITDAFDMSGVARTGGDTPLAATSTTVRYTCAEGLPLTVTYVNRGNGHVIFSIDGSPERRLEQAVSGSGSRYTDGRFTLLSKASYVTLQHPSGVDSCVEQ
ncbi:MliC family protein [Maritalea sp. S77]|jgi:membrane-bound inhibitor of C-type lysozyme|uniref:MliC family protein n=1 Tax=Maritalea sp. S77 TaxID=3415125 RepID=UPI003C7DF9E6